MGKHRRENYYLNAKGEGKEYVIQKPLLHVRFGTLYMLSEEVYGA